MNSNWPILTPLLLVLTTLFNALAANADKPELLYANHLGSVEQVANWTMEGPGQLTFKNGWMTLYSPGQTMHHVLWCPEEFPQSFFAEWEAQNLNTNAGLSIIFFAAKGLQGEGIFSPSLKHRDGTFEQYIHGDIRSYHISYYANAAHNKNRGHANLRKNNSFTLLQKGALGIPTHSELAHKIQLQKIGPRILMWVDNRKIIDYTDSQTTYWKDGKMGFRQMQWTKFRYRNFKVWSVKPNAENT